MPFLSLNRSTTTLCRHKALTIDDGKRLLDQANREGCFGLHRHRHRRFFIFKKEGPRFVDDVVGNNKEGGIDNFIFYKDSLRYKKKNGQSKEIQDLHRYTFQETFDGHTLGGAGGSTFIRRDLDGTPGELLIDSVIISYYNNNKKEGIRQRHHHHVAILFDKKLWIPVEKYDTFLDFVSKIPAADTIFRWLRKLYPRHIILDDAKEMIHKIYSLFFAVKNDFEKGMMESNNNLVAKSMRECDSFRCCTVDVIMMMEDAELIDLAACLCSALNHLFEFDFHIMKQKLYNRIKVVQKITIETSLRLGPSETASTA